LFCSYENKYETNYHGFRLLKKNPQKPQNLYNLEIPFLLKRPTIIEKKETKLTILLLLGLGTKIIEI
jgi:hypothetical protein